jgi:hypothetical protein
MIPLKNIIYFDISNNLITKLDDSTFIYNQKMESIGLQSNKLTTITNLTFSHMTGLQFAMLESNIINQIDNQSFIDTTDMREIHLYSNPIVSTTSPQVLRELCRYATSLCNVLF